MAYDRRFRFDIQKLYMLLYEHEMTQRELAEKLGVTEVSVSRWLHGDRVPGSAHILAMARYFNVHFEDLAELIDW